MRCLIASRVPEQLSQSLRISNEEGSGRAVTAQLGPSIGIATSHRQIVRRSHRRARRRTDEQDRTDSERSHRQASGDRTDKRKRIAPTSVRGFAPTRIDRTDGVRIAPTSVRRSHRQASEGSHRQRIRTKRVAPTSVRGSHRQEAAIAPTSVSAIAPSRDLELVLQRELHDARIAG